MPWTTEEIAQQFRLEVQQRFAAENEMRMKLERAEVAEVKAKLDAEGTPYPDWLTERDEQGGFFWEIYCDTEIQIESNAVKIIMPQGFAIYTDFVALFGGTSVAWSLPSIKAVTLDGEPRVCIELILIDFWDDDRHAAWFAAGKENAKALDSTTAVIEEQVAELRAESDRISKALVAAYTDIEVVTAERGHLHKHADAAFEKGYDQAAREIRDHFAKAGLRGISEVVETIRKRERRRDG